MRFPRPLRLAVGWFSILLGFVACSVSAPKSSSVAARPAAPDMASLFAHLATLTSRTDYVEAVSQAGFEALRERSGELKLLRTAQEDGSDRIELVLGDERLELLHAPRLSARLAYAQLYKDLVQAIDLIMRHEARSDSGPRFERKELEILVAHSVVDAHNEAYMPSKDRPPSAPRHRDVVEWERAGDLVILTPSFAEGAVSALRDNYKREAARDTPIGMVLDLRGSTGGQILAIREFLDWLLPAGPLGAAITVDGSVDECASKTQPDDVSQPLVVLVDADTASGAEWVAAVLQRRRRALVIGEQTAGIAAVVLPFQLPSGLFMYLRVGELVTTPEAPRIHERGVTPDVASQTTLFAACAASLPRSEDASLAVAQAWVRESAGPGNHPSCTMATRAVSQP